MTDLIRRLLEVFLAGVFLIVAGTLLAPVLPFNLAALGWLLVFAGVIGGAVILWVAVGEVSNSLS